MSDTETAADLELEAINAVEALITNYGYTQEDIDVMFGSAIEGWH